TCLRPPGLSRPGNPSTLPGLSSHRLSEGSTPGSERLNPVDNSGMHGIHPFQAFHRPGVLTFPPNFPPDAIRVCAQPCPPYRGKAVIPMTPVTNHHHHSS